MRQCYDNVRQYCDCLPPFDAAICVNIVTICVSVVTICVSIVTICVSKLSSYDNMRQCYDDNVRNIVQPFLMPLPGCINVNKYKEYNC